MKQWLLAVRPQTLLVSVAPVLISQALALMGQQHTDLSASVASDVTSAQMNFSLTIAFLCLGCALFLQMAVNLANDYFDYLSGVDDDTRLGPERAVQRGWITQAQMLKGFLVTLVIGMALGLVLLFITSWQLLWLGVICVLAVLAYTSGPFPLAYNALGEVAVFIVFGPIAVMGAYFAQHQIWWSEPLLCGALFSGLMASAIMLTNNIRDRDSDRAAGKHTLVYFMGSPFSRGLYMAMILAATASLIVMVYLIDSALWVWLVVPLALRLLKSFVSRDGESLNDQLAQTAQFMLLGSVLAVMDLFIWSHIRNGALKPRFYFDFSDSN
jgi:1,4-dihydroxy-2-naphthoate octaprenyltransferase